MFASTRMTCDKRFWLVVFGVLTLVISSDQYGCRQDQNCYLPDCFCSSSKFKMNKKDIPQIIYFGFDDALNVEMAKIYRGLFPADRKNPNYCPISMSLYISDAYTDYSLVNEFYHKGMEIGVHSVTHSNIDTGEKLRKEAKEQRENLALKGQVPIEDIIGWRSPNLKTAGDVQPDILQKLGYTYDISLTYIRSKDDEKTPWPYTLDYGYPYPCMIQPCPSFKSKRIGFWEVPVNSLNDYKNQFPCAYVDGCYNQPETEDEAFAYFWQNFLDYYKGSRAPFGFNMHAAWFAVPHRLRAMDRFIQEVLKYKDVYIVSVKQMLDWVRHPTPLSQIQSFQPWKCGKRVTESSTTSTIVTTTTTTTSTTTMTTTPSPITQSTTTTTPSTTSTTQSTTTPTTTPSTTTQSTTPTTTPPTTPSTTTQSTTTGTTTTPSTTSTTPSTTTPTKTQSTTTTTIFTATRPISTTPEATEKHVPQATTSPNIITSSKNGAAPKTSTTPPRVKPRLYAHLPPQSQPSCIQGWNCKLPNCLCRDTQPPSGLPVKDVPQFVYFTFDGSVTFRTYDNLVKLFNPARRNPDNCSISATLFVSNAGNSMSYLQSLAEMSLEVGMKGDDRLAYHRAEKLDIDLSKEISDFKAKLPVNKVRGWRSPALKPLGDSQYQILKSSNLLYDSTLSMPVSEPRNNLPWPYTLDFSWRETCEISGCPVQKYPGLWEVPVAPVYDYRGYYPCAYADGCILTPPTAEDTFNFLWNNFQEHYLGNRSPFGVNLRQQWFSHPLYKPNLQGLDDFIQKLTSLKDVYVISIENVIDWMKSPVSLNKMKNLKLWDCK